MKKKEITPASIWNAKKAAKLRAFVLEHSKKQTKEQLLQNELLGITFLLEDYIANEENKEKIEMRDFIKMYLHKLDITQRRLAALFEMKDSNLHKYLTGERKLNTDLVLKLSSFSHTQPETWYKLEIKNELIELKKDKKKQELYKKYDYRNLIEQ